MRTLAKADFPPEPARGTAEVVWFRAALDELVGELVARGPDAPAYTWWPADRTTGFWYRRMAQETAVHRVDVEGAFGEVTPVDEGLAVDGVDEMLDLFLGGDWGPSLVDEEDWGAVSPAAGEGTTTSVSTAGRSWRITLHRDRIDIGAGEGHADATVTADPSDLLLWLWGRVGDDAVAAEGGADVLSALRDRLKIAGQ